eukprot:77008-Prymnesium_polylepis.1
MATTHFRRQSASPSLKPFSCASVGSTAGQRRARSGCDPVGLCARISAYAGWVRRGAARRGAAWRRTSVISMKASASR